MNKLYCFVLLLMYLCSACSASKRQPEKKVLQEARDKAVSNMYSYAELKEKLGEELEKLSKLKYRKVRVSFASDRNFVEQPQPYVNPFGSVWSEKIRYGTCTVTIPSTHEIGEMESPVSFLGYKFKEDINRHIILQETELENRNEFFPQLSKRINENGEKKALIFIHGYNVSFEDAAKRTAQIHYDLNFNGVPIFYSWPSKQRLIGYMNDENIENLTTINVTSFLEDFFTHTQANSVYIIAHSMGNRPMMNALCALATSMPNVKDRIKEVILAAPDIDVRTFKHKIATKLKASCNRVTVYGSSTDKALLLSKQLHGHRRLGDTFKGVTTIPGIDFIDATGIDTDFLGHSYVTTNRTVLSDIANLINNGLSAARRFGLEMVNAKPTPYWKFAD